MNPVAGESVGNFSNSNVAGNCKIFYTHPFSQYLPEGSVGASNIDSGKRNVRTGAHSGWSGGGELGRRWRRDAYCGRYPEPASQQDHVGTLRQGPCSLDREPDSIRRPDAGREYALPDHQLTCVPDVCKDNSMRELNMPPRSERPKVWKYKTATYNEKLTSFDIVDSGYHDGKTTCRCHVCGSTGELLFGSRVTPETASGTIFEKYFDAGPGEPKGIFHWVCSSKCKDELRTALKLR